MVGNFQRVGQHIQANVRLVNVETGEIESSSLTQVQGNFDQLFELQADLAQKLVAHLNAQTPAGEIQHLQATFQATQSTKAHEFYIRGLSQLTPLSSDRELTQALNWFQKAIAEDANYALAYAGMAEVYAARASSPTAYASHQADDAAQAMHFAQKALQLKPDQASSFHALSYAYAAAGKSPEALQAAQEAVQRDNDSRYVRHYLSLKYGSQWRNDAVFDQVYAELEALHADLDDPLLLELLSSSYMLVVFQHPEHDHSAFLARLERGFDHNPRLTQLGIYLALMHKVLGHEDKFKTILNRAESANQDNPMALFIMSVALGNMPSESDRALRVANRILEIQPNFAPAYQIRAALYQERFHNTAKARNDIESSLKWAPENPDILDYAGKFYLEQQEPERAEQLLIKALKCNQDQNQNRILEAQANFHLGQVRAQQRHPQAAFEAYRRALENPAIKADDPRRRLYLQARAKLAAEQGDFDQALADTTQIIQIQPKWEQPKWEYKAYYLQRELQQHPQDGRLHNDLGQVYLQLGAAKEALGHLLIARKLLPQNAVVAYNLGLAQQELKQFANAQTAFAHALQLDPSYTKAAFGLAQVTYAQGDQAGAEKTLLHLLQQEPHYAKALELLAQIRENQGQPEEALKLWQQILSLNPQDYRARREVERLKP